MRKAFTGLTVAVVLSASLAATATEASAQQTSAGSAAVGNNYHMRNVTTGKCADVKNGSVDTGAIVHQWGCADLDSQRWAPVDAGNGFMVLHNQNSGWCMAVKDDADFNGAQIIQTVCNAADPGQRWSQVLLDVSGTSNVVSALGTGRCLEVNRADSANGAKIQIWQCSTASNAQRWKFE